MIYYETKLSYTNMEGKKTKEVHLVQAMNYADAESRMIEEISHRSFDGMPEVEIRKVKYIDIFTTTDADADKYYKAKVIYTTFDTNGDQMKEKKVASLFLVQAASLRAALQSLEKNLQGTASDYTIHTISETLILDYHNFSTADVNPAAVQ
ncbi:MAG: DUF4494 domain-containing protein [Bacteroidales bacterium]|nr:DUF4494 domain-containing protein [Candidatus Colicola faecequi]